MYEPQNFLDLHDGTAAGASDPKSWLSGGADGFSSGNSSPSIHRTLSSLSSSAAAGNVDPRLFNDLVEMVPLVQSLIERKQSSSFTRRGSMIYTKTPSRESLNRKTETKGRNAAQSIPLKKHRDRGDKEQSNADGLTGFSSSSSMTEMDREELVSLREQVNDLQRKLSEKDEILKSAEMSKNQLASVLAELDEIKIEAAAKESLLKSTELQLSDAKVKLADKRAAVEKLEWEAMTSNKKVEKLQQDMDRVQREISTFMLFFEGLQKNKATTPSEDYDDLPRDWDLVSDMDFDESKMQSLDEAREAYLVAVAAAKEKQDEESIAAAGRARLHLQSFVL